MEKFIFLATLKEKLTELDLPKEKVDKHVKIFEDCFIGKSAAEVDSVIDGAGGIDGIVKSVYNLEKAKSTQKIDTSDSQISPEDEPQENNDNFQEIKESDEVVTDNSEYTENPQDNNDVTKEIDAQNTAELNEHIREAEEITSELERTTINKVLNENEADAEFADDISEYDFEVLFAEKISKPEKWVMSLRQKLSEKAYKYSLPLAALADAIFFLISVLLYPILIASVITVALVYLAILVLGICFALVPIGYGVYMSFKIPTIGKYEIGLGVLFLGITMLSTILLYNYNKRLVPFLFKQLKKLFITCVKITKRYFGKTEKEEA